jgi:hypothetical protein
MEQSCLRPVKGELRVEKIKIESSLLIRAKRAAAEAGYSGVEEFVAHCVENELKKHKGDEIEGQVADQLRGLGYIE